VMGLASGVAAITTGNYHTCALTTSGGMKCWGNNIYGQIGVDTPDHYSRTPRDVPGLASGVAAITAGGNHTCAVTTAGGALCWGLNSDGQLGDGSFVDGRTIPVAVITKDAQTITFGSTPSVVTGGSASVSATATSGLVVAFTSLTPTTCTVSGSTVTGIMGGTCTIAADQAGNADFDPAPQVTQSFPVQCDPAPQFDCDGDWRSNGLEQAEGTDPLVKDNDVFANARFFAMQQYRDFLGREGDSGGINFWTDRINTAANTRAQVVESFFNSAEFQQTVAPVVRLYFAYFLRIPDYVGLQYWINYYKAGHSFDEISQAFAGSPEFANTYGSLSNGSFVFLVYRNVLGRNPDSAGFAYWTNQLDTGARTRGQVMLVFSESAEYKSVSINMVYVTMMYVGMLRRAPDQGGFDFWVGYLNNGNSGLALIGGFLAAPEYRARFLP
jgi:hypothetical protein